MKKIVLLCAGGASTGMLVRKMNADAEKQGLNYDISANGVSQAATIASDADAILLGPQVAYQIDAVKESVPGVPVESINMMDYGMMNSVKVLQQVAAMIGE